MPNFDHYIDSTDRERTTFIADYLPSSVRLPNGAEQLAFLSLRLLHTQYIADKMDIEQARLEKVRIAKQLEVNLLSMRTWEAAMAKERKLSTLTPQLKDSGCPLCRRFFYTLSGYTGEVK